MVVASLIIAIASIFIALGSAAYSRRQAVASEKLQSIETKRLHDDLTPQFRILCEPPRGGNAEVKVELTGPAGLDRLDEVTVRIRDDMADRSPRPGSGLSAEQFNAVIWGPYRFAAGVRDTDERGRQHGPFNLPKQEPHLLRLEETIAPQWWIDPPQWRRKYEGAYIRLELECRREGYEPWTVPVEVNPNMIADFMARAVIQSQ
jgi:hypothetical protein